MTRRQGAYRVKPPQGGLDQISPYSQAAPSRAVQGSASRPRRRLLSRRGWIGITAVILLSVFLTAAFVIVGRAAKFNDAVSSSSLFTAKLLPLVVGREPVNVLLLGHSPEGRDGALLTDSIAIMSIDPETDQTTAIPIPRDLWIEGIPELPGNGKINEAFAVGYQSGGWDEAGRRAMGVITSITGIPVAGWISVDFDGFREMVDAVGGVEVDNPAAFRWALGADDQAAGRWTGEFPAGTIRLAGMDALQYTRVRYTDTPAESTDFARTARQQRVLAAIRSKISADPGGIARAFRVMDALTGTLHTDLSAIDLLLLSGHLTADRRIELTEGPVLEATTNSAGQYVLVVVGRSSPSDYRPLHAYLARELASPGAPE